jgi:hypothetical protein
MGCLGDEGEKGKGMMVGIIPKLHCVYVGRWVEATRWKVYAYIHVYHGVAPLYN